MSGRIPVIDISPWRTDDEAARDALAREVDAACRDLGFLVITGHGIDMDLIWSLHRVCYDFFDLPMAEKEAIAFGKFSNYSGYGRFAGDLLTYSYDGDSDPSAAKPDLKESYGMGPFDFPDEPYYTGPAGGRFFQKNVWPEQVPGMQGIFEISYRRFERLSADLMRIMARGLALDDDFFDDKIDRHITHLNIQHYPAQSVDPVPGQLRAGAHSDFGSITVLHLGERPEGLQACDEDGVWHDVVVPEGAFVVNLGDLMAMWTNDVWRSTLHRVVNPAGEVRARARRQSVTFFHQPNYDAVIECIPTCTGPDNPSRYPPTTSGEHYLTKIARMRRTEDAASAAE